MGLLRALLLLSTPPAFSHCSGWRANPHTSQTTLPSGLCMWFKSCHYVVLVQCLEGRNEAEAMLLLLLFFLVQSLVMEVFEFSAAALAEVCGCKEAVAESSFCKWGLKHVRFGVAPASCPWGPPHCGGFWTWQSYPLGDGSFLILGELRAPLVIQFYHVVLGAISEMST